MIGGWENILDSHQKLNLCLGEEKKLIFDISEAGKGRIIGLSYKINLVEKIHPMVDHLGNINAKMKRNEVFEDLTLEQIGSYKHKLNFKPKYCGILMNKHWLLDSLMNF